MDDVCLHALILVRFFFLRCYFWVLHSVSLHDTSINSYLIRIYKFIFFLLNHPWWLVYCEVFTWLTTAFTFFFTLSRVFRTICYWFVFAFTRNPLNQRGYKCWLEEKIHAINFIPIPTLCAFFTFWVLSTRSAITSIIYILNTKHTTATNEKIPSKKLQLSDFNAGFWFLSWNSFSNSKERERKKRRQHKYNNRNNNSFKCQVSFHLNNENNGKSTIKHILTHNHRSPTFNHETLVYENINVMHFNSHQPSWIVCINTLTYKINRPVDVCV